MKQLATILWKYIATKRNFRRWNDRRELEAWQNRAVQKHLARVLPRSPFYQQLYGNRTLKDWRDFPITNKAALMANFDNWNTEGIQQQTALAAALRAERSRDFAPTIGNITVGLSSGTSGSRSLFLISPRERHAWAGTLLARILPGGLLEGHRAALCFRANSNLYQSVHSRLFQFRFFDLLEPPEILAQKLMEFQPTLLVAPPALLRIFAGEKRAGRLRIQPTRIFSVAEVLEPEERVVIEAAFGQRLHEIYQATEGFLAATCRHGTLHLNEDVQVVQKEWLDHTHRKFIPIITDFRRTTQPILRYRLTDILTEREMPCPCGSIFTALEKIEGRCDDLLRFCSAHNNGVIAVFPDFVRRAIVSADDSITEYSVTLRSSGILEISLKVRPETKVRAEQAVRGEFSLLCKTLGCQCPEIIFVPMIPSSLNEKKRRVRSERNDCLVAACSQKNGL